MTVEELVAAIQGDAEARERYLRALEVAAEGPKPKANDIPFRADDVWLRAWLCVSESSNSQHWEVATKWADECLLAFRSRFKTRDGAL